MKLFAFIISFYMLGLSCLPCGDRSECNMQAPTTVISSTTDHESHKHNTEHCTPFCTCSCCASSVSSHPVAEIQVAYSIPVSNNYPLQRSSYYPEMAYAIWQPPKIS